MMRARAARVRVRVRIQYSFTSRTRRVDHVHVMLLGNVNTSWHTAVGLASAHCSVYLHKFVAFSLEAQHEREHCEQL